MDQVRHNDSMAMSIMHNRYLVLALALLLSSCQAAGPAGQAAVPAPSAWQVLERVGETHVQAPGTGGWAEIMARDRISAASTLVTGTGGRLILARPGGQIVIGPNSRVHLPAAEHEARLEQTEGRVRYRIAGSAEPFAVVTPALNVQASGTILEVAVGAAGTELTVETGEARIATLDGRSVGVVPAGGSARAARDAALMVQGAPGQDFEGVEPVLASSRQPALAPPAKRSLEAEIGGRATPRDAAHAPPVAAAAAGRGKASSGPQAPVAGPARLADDDGGRELVVVPAGFPSARERSAPPSALAPDGQAPDDAIAVPPAGADPHRQARKMDAAENAQTAEDDGAASAAPDDPFAGFTDGLLGSLSPVIPRGR